MMTYNQSHRKYTSARVIGWLLTPLLLATFLISCKENEYEGFESDGSVYFQTNADNWNMVNAGTNYSFAGKTIEQDTVWMQVNLLGTPVDHDRQFGLAEASGNEAVAGTHYEAFKNSYTMKAGEMTARVPVIIYNSEDIKTKRVRLAFSLVATNDLGLGLQGRTDFYIDITNFLNKPSYWDEPWDPYAGTEWEGYYAICAADYWGPYSRRKHEICLEQLGRDFPADLMTLLSDEYWNAASAYMSQYFTDNYPVYDENGEIIEPWY